MCCSAILAVHEAVYSGQEQSVRCVYVCVKWRHLGPRFRIKVHPRSLIYSLRKSCLLYFQVYPDLDCLPLAHSSTEVLNIVTLTQVTSVKPRQPLVYFGTQ